MKFQVSMASDWGYQDEIEIDTLDGLMGFIQEHEEDIVISSDLKRIIIYDYYIE